jgi:hypothetical protein
VSQMASTSSMRSWMLSRAASARRVGLIDKVYRGPLCRQPILAFALGSRYPPGATREGRTRRR